MKRFLTIEIGLVISLLATFHLNGQEQVEDSIHADPSFIALLVSDMDSSIH